MKFLNSINSSIRCEFIITESGMKLETIILNAKYFLQIKYPDLKYTFFVKFILRELI